VWRELQLAPSPSGDIPPQISPNFFIDTLLAQVLHLQHMLLLQH
jgi:hypothetical protein